MNKFIKKNLFLVGVLAIAAVGILVLLVMAARKIVACISTGRQQKI